MDARRLLTRIATLAALAASAAAHAQFSSTITLVSDYDYRGISLSAREPALQGSADYAFGESGFSVGAWATNIDSGPDIDGDFEIDAYVDYTRMFGDTFGFTTGASLYTYPGSDDLENYPEAYVGLLAGGFELRQWYADDYIGADVSAWYTEANYTFELPANLSLSLHAGYSYGDAFDDAELMDFSVGLDYAPGNFVLGLKLVGTDASGELKETGDVFNNEPRILASIETTLPWDE